jgi:O-antigen/teichoic acid export membrane protein
LTDHLSVDVAHPRAEPSGAARVTPDGDGPARGSGRAPSLTGNAGTAAALIVAKAAILFVASVVFTRSVGPSGRGEIVFVLNAAAILVLLAGAGTGSALLRMRRAGNHSVAEMSTAAACASAVHTVVAAAVFMTGWALLRDSAFEGVGPGRALAVVALVGPLLLYQNLTQVTILDNRLSSTAVSSLAGGSLYLVTVTAAALTGRLNAPVVITAFAAGSVLTPCLMIWPFRVVRFERAGLGAALGSLLRAAMAANLATMSILLLWRVDVLLMKSLRSFADLGRYSAATSMAEIALILVISLRAALLAHQGSNLDRAELGAVIGKTVRVGLAAGLVGAVGIALVSRPLLTLVYGAGYAEAWAALAILAPGVIIFGLHYPLFDALFAAGEARKLTAIGLGALAFEVVADVLLVPGGGYVVAAVVSTTTYTVLFLFCAAMFARRYQLPWRDVVVVRAADVRDLAAIARDGLRRCTPRSLIAGHRPGRRRTDRRT